MSKLKKCLSSCKGRRGKCQYFLESDETLGDCGSYDSNDVLSEDRRERQRKIRTFLDQQSFNMSSEDPLLCCIEDTFLNVNICQPEGRSLELDFDIVSIDSEITLLSYSSDTSESSSSFSYGESYCSYDESDASRNEHFGRFFQRKLKTLLEVDDEEQTVDETHPQSRRAGVLERIRSLPRPGRRKRVDTKKIDKVEEQASQEGSYDFLCHSFTLWKNSLDEKAEDLNQGRSCKREKSFTLPLNYSTLWQDREESIVESGPKRKPLFKFRRQQKQSPSEDDTRHQYGIHDLNLGHFLDFLGNRGSFNQQGNTRI